MELSNIGFQYGSQKILSNVSYKFEKNKKYLIQGPNGVGKSTLLKVLSGHLIPSEGEVTLDGQNIHADFDKHKNQIGYLSTSDTGLHPLATGKENLYLIGKLLKKSQSEIDKNLSHWETISIWKESLETPFFKCSTGMKAILCLASRSLHEPKIYILDESLRSLDTNNSRLVEELLLSKLGAETLILAAHEGNYKNDWIKLTLDGGKLAQ